MEQVTHETFHEKLSLLRLNDDCLRDIIKFLGLDDYVNLAVTCSRLLCVARQNKKFKNIAVTRYGNGSPNTMEEFSHILSVIGIHVASVDIRRGNNFSILKTIADNCTNLTSVELFGNYCIPLDDTPIPFRNLKELIVRGCIYLTRHHWRNCFTNNPGIENLEYNDNGRNDCIALLQMLPKLKSLSVEILSPELFHHLSYLTNLTKLSFTSENNCNLIELVDKLNLVELEFKMCCDADTFASLEPFPVLEVLSIFDCCRTRRVPENTIFPSMLKKIKLDGFQISCSHFLSLVKQLKLLEEFDLAYGNIFWDNDECKSFHQNHVSCTHVKFVFLLLSDETFPAYPYRPGHKNCSRIISRILNELREEKIKLKIIFAFCGPIEQVVSNFLHPVTHPKINSFLFLVQVLR